MWSITEGIAFLTCASTLVFLHFLELLFLVNAMLLKRNMVMFSVVGTKMTSGFWPFTPRQSSCYSHV